MSRDIACQSIPEFGSRRIRPPNVLVRPNAFSLTFFRLVIGVQQEYLRNPSVSHGPFENGDYVHEDCTRQARLPCYHMSVTHLLPGPTLCWEEALETNYADALSLAPNDLKRLKKPYGQPEFDSLLGQYTAVSDMPCVLFSDEMISVITSNPV
jgi:hypothetical protein